MVCSLFPESTGKSSAAKLAAGSAKSRELLGEVWGAGSRRDPPALHAKPHGFSWEA